MSFTLRNVWDLAFPAIEQDFEDEFTPWRHPGHLEFPKYFADETVLLTSFGRLNGLSPIARAFDGYSPRSAADPASNIAGGRGIAGAPGRPTDTGVDDLQQALFASIEEPIGDHPHAPFWGKAWSAHISVTFDAVRDAVDQWSNARSIEIDIVRPDIVSRLGRQDNWDRRPEAEHLGHQPPRDEPDQAAMPAARPQPTVATDKDDYPPGATVEITATNFTPGGLVTFEIDHVSGPGDDGAFGTTDDVVEELGGRGHDPWTVRDGSPEDLDGAVDGSVTTQWHVDPDDSAHARFLLTARDETTGAVATTTFTDNPTTFEVRISSGLDDVEESSTGSVSTGSSDLELVNDGSTGDQTVGLRFTGIDIPKDAVITNAYLQFQVDETDVLATSLTIHGEAADDAAAFTGAAFDVSSRGQTTASVSWTPPAWDTVGEAGAGQQTPDLSAIIQEIVTREGWTADNALVLTLTGSGARTAESFEGDAQAAPLLHIEWQTATGSPPTSFDLSATAVDEHAAAGTVIGTFGNVVDPDAGDTHTFALVDDAGGRFRLSGSDLEVADGTLLDFESATSHDVVVRVQDSGGQFLDQTFTITLNDINDAPVITNLDGDTLTYTAGSGALALDQGGDAVVDDVDSADYDTGQLTVSIVSGGDGTQDVLAIADQGTGAGQIGLSGAQDVTYEGTVIGSYAGGDQGNDLVVTLLAAAGNAAVQALVRALTYENTEQAAPTTGDRTLNITLTDGDGATSQLVATTVSVRQPGAPSVFEVRISSGLDDVEESSTGSVSTGSSDLELVNDGSTGDQTVGLRFTGIDIPKDAVITNAYLQFQVDETDVLATSLTIHGEAADDAAAFTGAAFDVSSRGQTTASVSWTPPAWDTVGEAGAGQQTPDLSAIIQEIVTREGWTADNALVLTLTGSGARTAESFEGDAQAAPLLHIEWQTATGSPPTSFDLSATAVDEHAAAGTVIGTFGNVVDPDAGDTHTFALVDDAGGRFRLSGSDLEVADGTLLDFESATSHDVVVRVQDSGGQFLDQTFTITLNDINDAPVITNLDGDTLTYTAGSGALALDQGGDAVVDDVDSADYDTGQLTVSIVSGGDGTQDVLAIADQGTGAGQIGLSGAQDVTYEGTVIGSYAGGDQGNDLVVTLLAAAGNAAVQALVRALTYENTEQAAPTTGDRTLNITLTDGDGATSQLVATTVSVRQPGAPSVFEVRISSGLDDVEESSTGSVSTGSSDLELVNDGSTGDQTVGLRFTGIDIPKDAVITNAYLQFQVDETDVLATSLTIHGEAADDAAAFTGAAFDVSSRGQTTASVSWTPPAWDTVGEAGAGQQTPDLSAIIQEIVTREGWTADNALVLTLTGSGARTAESFEGDAQAAPLLHIEWQTATGSPPTSFDLSATAVDEHAAAGTVIGTFGNVVDPDAGDTHTFALVDDAGGRFRLSGSDLEVADGTLLDFESATSHDVVVRVQDSGGQFLDQTFTITLNDINDAPVITNLDGDTLTYTAGSGALALDQGGDAVVDDVDSADYDTGQLTVSIVSGGDGTQDVLAIADQGTGAGQIGLSGAQDVTYEGTVIGSYAGGDQGNDLVVTLLAAAGNAAVQALVRALTYENTEQAAPTTGDRTLNITLTDGDGATSQLVATTVTVFTSPPVNYTEQLRISSGIADVEEAASGSVSTSSSDLELVNDGSTGNQTVGLRFERLFIPKNAVITNAYLQFQVDETDSVTTSLMIHGEAADDAVAFTGAAFDVSSRGQTTASVAWTPPAWDTVGAAGADQQTPDLSAIIQEIVNRDGWSANNALVLTLTGSGARTAESFDGDPQAAPLLHIEFQAPPDNPANSLPTGTLSIAVNTGTPFPGSTLTAVNALADADGLGAFRYQWERSNDGGANYTPIGLDQDSYTLTNDDLGYQVRVVATYWDGAGTLETVASASTVDVTQPGADVMRFAIIGDYGNDSIDEQNVADLVDGWNVDFILTVGDNAYGAIPFDDAVGKYYADYIGNYSGAYGSGSTINRFFPSLGNHDYSDDSAGLNGGIDIYLDYFDLPDNERYYDFQIGNTHFFAINSNSEPDGNESDSVQAQWLQSALAASEATHKVVFFHHPPFSSDGAGGYDFMRWDFEAWGATAVLAGHDHIFERILRDENSDGTAIPYIISGVGGESVGSAIPTDPGSQALYDEGFGASLVTVTNDVMLFEFYAVDGTLIDTYTFEAPLAGNPLFVDGNDTLNGTANSDYLDGHDGNDTLNGLAGDDVLVGGSGNDTLNPGPGDDRINVDGGDDMIIFAPGDGKDTIENFIVGAGSVDKVDLTGFDPVVANNAITNATQVGNDTVLDFGNGDELTFVGTIAANLHSDDFLL